MLNVYKFHTEPESLLQRSVTFEYTDSIAHRILQRYLNELNAGEYPNVMQAFGADKFDYAVSEDGDVCDIYPLGISDSKAAAYIARVRTWEGDGMNNRIIDSIVTYNFRKYQTASEPLTNNPIEQAYKLFVKMLSHMADNKLRVK